MPAVLLVHYLNDIACLLCSIFHTEESRNQKSHTDYIKVKVNYKVNTNST